MTERSADHVIVEAGSAGCVLADRLSADPAVSVLLMAAGGRDRIPWIHIPVGHVKTRHDPGVDRCDRTAPDPGPTGRALDGPRGKVPGGSSSLNGPVDMRGQPQDDDRPAQIGTPGRGWDAVVEARQRAHGLTGLRIADCSIMFEIVSGNANAPAIMIGEKAADMILRDRKSGAFARAD